MSFPRISDVSKHLVRKTKGGAKRQMEPTPLTDSAKKERDHLTERLLAVVHGTSKSSATDDGL